MSEGDEMAYEKLYEEIISLLSELSDDPTIPRNIRRGITHAKETLTQEEKPLDVRVASAVYELEDISGDPNIPVHGRTMVYMALGKLESLLKEIKS